MSTRAGSAACRATEMVCRPVAGRQARACGSRVARRSSGIANRERCRRAGGDLDAGEADEPGGRVGVGQLGVDLHDVGAVAVAGVPHGAVAR